MEFHPLAPDPHAGAEEQALENVVSENLRVVGTKSLCVSDVPHNIIGVSKLLTSGSYRAAASLSSQLLALSSTELTTQEKNGLRVRRAVALASAGMLSEASAEIDTLLTSPTSHTTTSSTSDESVSSSTTEMISFMLRFAKAQLPAMLRASRGPIALYDLLSWCEYGELEQKSITTNSPSPTTTTTTTIINWDLRICVVLGAIASRHALGQEYDLAIEALERILMRHQNDPKILSDIGRCYLALGGLNQAALYFKEAEKFLDGGQASHLALANSALLKFSREEYTPAIELLNSARGIQDSQSLANNCAVAWVYSGNLNRGLSSLREAVSKDPRGSEIDVLVANLNILYDLTSDNSDHKKSELQQFVSSHSNQS